jgi:predicted component of type VI protein secretion system
LITRSTSSSLAIRVSGPGSSSEFRLTEGDTWILGRDRGCQICLPSPGISRRHLALKCEGHELVFDVLSSVNSVEGPGGWVPPGGRGRARAGDVIALGEFTMEVGEAPAEQSEDGTSDLFGSLCVSAPPAEPASAGETDMSNPWRALIRDWDDQLGLTGASVPEREKDLPPGFRAFFEGMGLRRPPLTLEEGWRAGVMVRLIVEALVDLLAVRDRAMESPATEGAKLDAKHDNPLKLPLPIEEKVRYLLFSARLGDASMPAEQALKQALSELRHRESAGAAATRAAVKGTIGEFAPRLLRERLRGGNRSWPRMLDSAMLWRAYERDYERRSAMLAEWVDECLSCHYSVAYAKGLEESKRKT